MTMNKTRGNMYGFVTHTWNPIKGKCRHDCEYCYMKVWKQKPIRLVEKELKDVLGDGNFIFVGSSTDMFADDVPVDWIERVLSHCDKYDRNKYLFQTKNPKRFHEFFDLFPEGTILCTTIETNCINANSPKAPTTYSRKSQFEALDWNEDSKMITIEPIMDFEVDVMVKWLKDINPFQVNIGADSKGHNLSEPSKEKIETLIKALEPFTEVKLKDNLKRLMK